MKKNIAALPTLNAAHNEIIINLKNNENKVPGYEAKIVSLTNDNLNIANSNLLYYIDKTYLYNIDEIKTIKEKLLYIKTAKIDYYLKNANIIFDYNEAEKVSPFSSLAQSAVKTLFDKSKSTVSSYTNNVVININASKKNNIYHKSKADILKDYLLNNSANYNHIYIKDVIINDTTYCNNCNVIRELNEHEAKLTCYTCGESINIILESDKPSTKDYPIESRHYEYKKFNHFCYWLAKIQGKESCDIPDEVIETIKNEIKKDRITDLSILDESHIKDYLKKNIGRGYNKYYNHTIYILMRITGIPPIILSLEQEREYKMMFLIIQELYEIYKPEDRSNFGSYSYIIFKFAQLRGDIDIMSKMKLLKCKEKLHN